MANAELVSHDSEHTYELADRVICLWATHRYVAALRGLLPPALGLGAATETTAAVVRALSSREHLDAVLGAVDRAESVSERKQREAAVVQLYGGCAGPFSSLTIWEGPRAERRAAVFEIDATALDQLGNGRSKAS
jgi:hypothetical protein